MSNSFVTPMDCGTPGPIGFSRQEHWSGLPFPRPGDLSSSRDPTRIPCVSCTGTQILYPKPPGSPKECRDLGTARNLNGISLCSVLIFPVLFGGILKTDVQKSCFRFTAGLKGRFRGSVHSYPLYAWPLLPATSPTREGRGLQLTSLH